MNYKAVIFDLDGTILNTLDDLADSVNYALSYFGFPVRTIDEVREFVGNGIKNLILRAVPKGTSEQTAEKVLDCFKSYYKEHSAVKTKAYDGINQCILNLKQKDIKIAVVTNKAHFAAVPLCDMYFPGLIDVVIGEREGVRKKPHPDTVIQAMESIGVVSSDCVYVGDSDVDIDTAKNSGMPCISVTWGFRSRDFLLDNGATTIVDTIEQLYDSVTTKKMV